MGTVSKFAFGPMTSPYFKRPNMCIPRIEKMKMISTCYVDDRSHNIDTGIRQNVLAQKSKEREDSVTRSLTTRIPM